MLGKDKKWLYENKHLSNLQRYTHLKPLLLKLFLLHLIQSSFFPCYSAIYIKDKLNLKENINSCINYTDKFLTANENHGSYSKAIIK